MLGISPYELLADDFSVFSTCDMIVEIEMYTKSDISINLNIESNK